MSDEPQPLPGETPEAMRRWHRRGKLALGILYTLPFAGIVAAAPTWTQGALLASIAFVGTVVTAGAALVDPEEDQESVREQALGSLMITLFGTAGTAALVAVAALRGWGA